MKDKTGTGMRIKKFKKIYKSYCKRNKCLIIYKRKKFLLIKAEIIKISICVQRKMSYTVDKFL